MAKQMSPREQIMVVSASVVIISYVFYQYLINPKLQDITRLKEEARTKRIELKTAEGKMKIFENVERQLGTQAFQMKTMSPSEKSLESLKIISNAVAKSGLVVNSIRPIVEEKKEGEGAVGEEGAQTEQTGQKFIIECTGDYASFYKLLASTYNLQVRVMLNELTVNADEDNDDLKINITLKVFY